MTYAPEAATDIADLFPGWTRIICSGCGGHGVVSDYGDGEDFYGPKDCDDCLGSGFIWRSPKGYLAAYPGGPFRGREKVATNG